MLSNSERQSVIDLYPFMGDHPVVFDCGSNKGHWSDVILDEFKDKCDIHLFEPNKKLLSFTEIKYEYRPEVKFHNIGLMNENGSREFYFFENFNNEISSFYNGGDEWNELPMKKETVDVRKGDWICDRLKINRINYLKIDAEGGDCEALLGFEKMMSEYKIGIIQIEYSHHWSRANYSFLDLIGVANKHGYKIFRYIEDNFWEVKEENPDFDNYYLTKYEIHNYSVGGWNNEFIINTSELPKINLAIEIGAMEGGTTKYICNKLLNDSGEARVIVVDPLYDYYVTDDPRYHPEFRNQYQRFKRNTRGFPVDLKRGESKDELPKLHALRADLIFVDGNHYAPWPYHDLCWAFALTKVGGIIIADDYNLWAQETKDNIDKFLNEFNGFYDIIHIGYQVVIRKVTNKYNEITQSYYL